MKTWSKDWKSSKQPRKQRKYAAKAPLHVAKKFLSTLLSESLRKKYNKRNIPLRKGDTIKVLRGQFKGTTGKIEKVFTKLHRVAVEGVYLTKKDGNRTIYRLHPSKLMITELNLEDKKRVKPLERK